MIKIVRGEVATTALVDHNGRIAIYMDEQSITAQGADDLAEVLCAWWSSLLLQHSPDHRDDLNMLEAG